MRITRRLFAALLALTLGFALLLPCFAEDGSAESPPYMTNRWRFSDATDLISREDKERVDNLALEGIEQYHFDFVVGIIYDSRQEHERTEDYCSRVYYANGYGYGKEQEGTCFFVLLREDEPPEYHMGVYGPNAEAYFPREKREELTDAFIQDVEGAQTPEEGYPLAAEHFVTAAAQTVKLAQAAELANGLIEKTVPAPTESGEENSETPSMPEWYPESWDDFQYFYDPNAPQLTDTADIFTDAEEETIRAQLKTLRETYGTDFVVFTDVSTYGLSRKVYAADFFEATGHGLGEDFSGMILFISMEQGNRGWWTAAKGSVRPLFSESNINGLDDQLEPYMVRGDYGEGVIDYLGNIDYLYREGRLPIPLTVYLVAIGGALVAGLAVGLVVMSFVKSTMNTVKEAAHADSYLVKGSFDLRHSRDIFLYTTVSRIKREHDSGGGGGSSYSGSYSSSSGSSWSGGGRSF